MNISTEAFSSPRVNDTESLSESLSLAQIVNGDDNSALSSEQIDTTTDAINTPDTLNEATTLGAFYDIPLQMTVELGRVRMEIRNLLQLSKGSVVELNTMSGRPLDLFINGSFVGRGDVVMVGDKLGVRLTEVLTPGERLRKSNPT